MWIVAKIKIKELYTFKKKLTEKCDKNIKFYCPKIVRHKYFRNKIKKFEKPILENYVFCHHVKFKEAGVIGKMKYLKGLVYFLNGCEKNQNELIKFIEYCKSFENSDGYLMSTFFKNVIKNRGQFLSGPFTNMMFEIIAKQKNKLKIAVDNIVMTVSDNKYLYRPI
jgi:hypothetical protein|tara:strand:+ start:300 stop:797 length:498 start_codon:yes stop_codon:yes gene_type:complete